MGQLMIRHGAGGGSKKNLDSWNAYDLSTTISGLFTDVVSHAGQSSVSQDTSHSRVSVQMSNSGANSGFLTKFPIDNGLALHFVSNSNAFIDNYHFNNWIGCGFDDRSFTATINTVNAFRFGWSNSRNWSALAMFFASGGWLVCDGVDCYFLDDNYNITAHKTLDTAPTNLWFSDQKSDSGATVLNLYIDQIKYK